MNIIIVILSNIKLNIVINGFNQKKDFKNNDKFNNNIFII